MGEGMQATGLRSQNDFKTVSKEKFAMYFKTLFLVVSLFATCAVVHATTEEPIPGDLDLDGDVDVADFLIFTANFGKTGPVPSQTPTTSPERKRAENLLGFWKLLAELSSIGSVLDYYYILGYISDQPFDDGELPVWGGDDLGRRILGGYNKGLSRYTILESNSSYNGFFVFDIQGDKAVGIMYFYDKGESINQGSVYNLTSDSGRTQGEGFDVHAPKLAIPPELADQGRKVGAIPQEIIDAHDRLKARLDQSDL